MNAAAVLPCRSASVVTAPLTSAFLGTDTVVNAPSWMRVSSLVPAVMFFLETTTVTLFAAGFASLFTPWTYRKMADVAPTASSRATAMASPLGFISILSVPSQHSCSATSLYSSCGESNGPQAEVGPAARIETTALVSLPRTDQADGVGVGASGSTRPGGVIVPVDSRVEHDLIQRILADPRDHVGDGIVRVVDARPRGLAVCILLVSRGLPDPRIELRPVIPRKMQVEQGALHLRGQVEGVVRPRSSCEVPVDRGAAQDVLGADRVLLVPLVHVVDPEDVEPDDVVLVHVALSRLLHGGRAEVTVLVHLAVGVVHRDISELRLQVLQVLVVVCRLPDHLARIGWSWIVEGEIPDRIRAIDPAVHDIG